MRIEIKVIPGAKREAWKEEDGRIKVYLTAPPVDGKANQALIKFLARRFGVAPSAITITKGLQSRLKVINIDD
jgi:uncharacterized protein (TIGR00251 family)